MNRSFESIIDVELDNALNYSDEEVREDPVEKLSLNQFQGKKGKKYHQEIDTNVFKINMETLKAGG